MSKNLFEHQVNVVHLLRAELHVPPCLRPHQRVLLRRPHLEAFSGPDPETPVRNFRQNVLTAQSVKKGEREGHSKVFVS